jgi:hypothetical protein
MLRCDAGNDLASNNHDGADTDPDRQPAFAEKDE